MDKPNPPKPSTFEDLVFYRVTFSRFVRRGEARYRPRNDYVLRGDLARELGDAIATAVIDPRAAIG